jgi:ketopantoate reductase
LRNLYEIFDLWCGVIGSIFAGKLASSGCDVTVLARGKQFNELKKHGVILMRPGAKKQEQVFVKVIDTLTPEDINGQVNYFIGKGFMRIFQTTTFAEYSGKITQRLDVLVQIFRKTRIPAVTTRNMDNWQKNHVAIVTSIGNALYRYDGDNYAFSRSYKDVRLMISGIKEGFSVLNRLGIKTTPTKLNFFKLPTGLLAIIFKVFMGTI